MMARLRPFPRPAADGRTAVDVLRELSARFT
jgi:hypothetical protein